MKRKESSEESYSQHPEKEGIFRKAQRERRERGMAVEVFVGGGHIEE